MGSLPKETVGGGSLGGKIFKNTFFPALKKILATIIKITKKIEYLIIFLVTIDTSVKEAIFFSSLSIASIAGIIQLQ